MKLPAAVAVLAFALLAAPPAGAALLFNQQNPGQYSWTVPADLHEISVIVDGAQGGYGYTQEYGGETRAVLPVTPGQILQIRVGGRGGLGAVGVDYNVIVAGGAGGYNGGGAGGAGNGKYGTSGGGGASDIRTSDALDSRLVVAGGGGGRGSYQPGGDGGGVNGGNGYLASGNFPPLAQYGHGGTQTGGGSAGAGRVDGREGAPGSFGQGGAGGNGTLYQIVYGNIDEGGGGGGGGWYGGGGGAFAGSGGGGSGYGPAGATLTSGVRAYDGQVRIYDAPAPPTALATVPATTGSDTTPYLMGTLEPGGATVHVYTTPDCTGPVVAQGAASDLTNWPGIELSVPVTANASTSFYATVTDGVGATSACSTDSATYQHDSIAPGAPTGLVTLPGSPANDNSPVVKGVAEAGTVRVFASAACTGTAVASGSATTFGSDGLPVTVGDDSTTVYSANVTDAAGNASTCSLVPVTYVEDSTAPAVPSAPVVATTGPVDDNTATVTGMADPGSTVRLYATADCTGPVLAQGSAADFAAPGLEATVPDDSTTAFYATATDPAGNASACSPTSSPYVEDSTAPAAPSSLAVSPGAAANDNSPKVSGAAEPGSTVKLYTASGCTGAAAASGPAAAFASPGFTVAVPDDSSTAFYATATDVAGHASPCTTSPVTYVEQSKAAPTGPTDGAGGGPKTPASNPAPAQSIRKLVFSAKLHFSTLSARGLGGQVNVVAAGTRLLIEAFADTTGKAPKAARRVTIGALRKTAGKAGKTAFTIKLNRAGKKFLKGRRSARILIVVRGTSPAGTVTRLTRRVTVKR